MSNFIPLTIVFPIYPGVTQLDFTGPHQFFSRLPGVKPVVASIEGKSIVGDGLTFSDLVSLEQIDRCDVLCVPGGFGCTDAIQDPRYLSAIQLLAENARYITSVCTGSLNSAPPVYWKENGQHAIGPGANFCLSSALSLTLAG